MVLKLKTGACGKRHVIKTTHNGFSLNFLLGSLREETLREINVQKVSFNS